jgi:hypothetical protein
MTERDVNRGDGRPAGSTYASTADQPRSPQSSAGADTAGADGNIRQKVKDDVESVRHMAQGQMSNVSAKAEEAADRQKGYAAEKVAGIATVIEKVGSELEGQDQPEIGRMARQMGESVHRFADDIKGRSLGDIAGMAEDFGRKQPLAFLGMAAIAGLAASRFVGASASRQSPMSSRPSHARPSGAAAAGGRTAGSPGATGSPGMETQPSSAAATDRPAPAVSTTPKTSAPATSTMPGAGTTTGGANG